MAPTPSFGQFDDAGGAVMAGYAQPPPATPNPLIQLYTIGIFGKGSLSRSVPQRLHQSHQGSDTTSGFRRPFRGLSSTPGFLSRRTAALAATTVNLDAGSQDLPRKSPFCENDEDIEGTEENQLKEPQILQEHLQLTLLEAYFLQHVLRILRVHTESGETLSDEALWKLYLEREPRAWELFAAYYALRASGWIPHAGMQMGSDFIVYADDPERVHASYLVHVVSPEQASNHRSRVDTCIRTLRDFRVAESLAKPIMLITVEFDERLGRSAEEEEKKAPASTLVSAEEREETYSLNDPIVQVAHARITTQIYQRWVPTLAANP